MKIWWKLRGLCLVSQGSMLEAPSHGCGRGQVAKADRQSPDQSAGGDPSWFPSCL